MYVIHGTYRLGSEEKAQLVASGATNEKHGAEAKQEAEKQRIIREILAEYIVDSQKTGSRPAPEVIGILRGMLTAAPMQNTQKIDVERGEGRFSLIYYMWDKGKPHLALYPSDGGTSFGKVYFGTGDSLLLHGDREKQDAARRRMASNGNFRKPTRRNKPRCKTCRKLLIAHKIKLARGG